MEALTVILTLVGTIFTAIITSYLLVTKMVRTERDLNIAHSEQIKTLFKNEETTDHHIEAINNEIKELLQKRMDDNLKFTEALARLNNTLTKFNTTLEHFNDTIKESMNNSNKRLEAVEKTIIEITAEAKLKKA